MTELTPAASWQAARSIMREVNDRQSMSVCFQLPDGSVGRPRRRQERECGGVLVVVVAVVAVAVSVCV